MASLYELKGEYLTLLDYMSEDPEDIALADTLEAVKGEIEIKSEGYARVIRQAEADYEVIKSEFNFLKAKKERYEKNIKQLKEAVKEALVMTGHDDKVGLKAGPYTLKVAGNGGKQPLKIDGPVPDGFMKIIFEPDMDKIREHIANNNTCNFAHLEERGTHLTIK